MHPILEFLRNEIRGTRFDDNVFVAGGYVRDLLLGRESKDIDLVITLPQGGIDFAQWITARLGVQTPGNPVLFPRFGTAKFNLRQAHLENIDIEAVMPRTEAYTSGSRKPDVQYTTLEEDAKRRDFTVNAMFLNVSTGEILDLVDGKHDLQSGLIRTAIDPAVIFVDDPLRMLRAVRFAVRFNWRIHDVILEALPVHASRITTISQERIADELSKMLTAGQPSEAFRLLRTAGLLELVLPEVAALSGVTQNRFHTQDVFEHTLAVLDGTPPDLVTRLGALFHDIGKPKTRTEEVNFSTGLDDVHFYKHEEVGVGTAVQALQRLRLPNVVIDAVAVLVHEHMRLKQTGADGSQCSDKALRKLRVDIGDNLPALLAVMHADNLAHAPGHAMPHQIPGIQQRLDTLVVKPKVIWPITGGEIMELFGITPGPEVGRLKDIVKEAWFENPEITHEEVIALLRKEFCMSQLDRIG